MANDSDTPTVGTITDSDVNIIENVTYTVEQGEVVEQTEEIDLSEESIDELAAEVGSAVDEAVAGLEAPEPTATEPEEAAGEVADFIEQSAELGEELVEEADERLEDEEEEKGFTSDEFAIARDEFDLTGWPDFNSDCLSRFGGNSAKCGALWAEMKNRGLAPAEEEPEPEEEQEEPRGETSLDVSSGDTVLVVQEGHDASERLAEVLQEDIMAGDIQVVQLGTPAGMEVVEDMPSNISVPFGAKWTGDQYVKEDLEDLMSAYAAA